MFAPQIHCKLVKGIYKDKNRYPETDSVYVQFFEANESNPFQTSDPFL